MPQLYDVVARVVELAKNIETLDVTGIDRLLAESPHTGSAIQTLRKLKKVVFNGVGRRTQEMSMSMSFPVVCTHITYNGFVDFLEEPDLTQILQSVHDTLEDCVLGSLESIITLPPLSASLSRGIQFPQVRSLRVCGPLWSCNLGPFLYAFPNGMVRHRTDGRR